MTQNPQEGAPAIYPVLSYQDAAAAMAWLERAFGFKKVMEVPTPDGGIAHAEMSFGTYHPAPLASWIRLSERKQGLERKSLYVDRRKQGHCPAHL